MNLDKENLCYIWATFQRRMLYLVLVGILTSGCEAIWHPHQHMSWNIVIGESASNINTGISGDAYDVDLFDTPKSLIDTLHSKGKKVICYFSAGSYENWRPDKHSFPHDVLGHSMEHWTGEKWLDIRDQRLHPIMQKRMDLAKSKGCDAVDPDNVDAAFNKPEKTGLHLSPSDQLTYNKFLASEAHKRNLAVGLKNDVDQLSELVDYFDFAVNEECMDYNECFNYKPFFAAGKPVFHLQYVGSNSEAHGKKDQICQSSKRPPDMNTLIKDEQLTNWKVSC